jgi:heparin binding hemagglutinin HbhA
MAPSADKTRRDIENAITDPTPLYALVGAGDVAVAALRTASSELGARAAKLSPKALREQAQSSVEGAPAQVQALPGKATAALTDVVSSAVTAYADLAGRGRTLVTSVRRQSATSDVQSQAKATVSKVKAASTTARTSAARTSRAAKSAGTSAKRTASAAKKAAEATADKIGD